MQKKNKNKNKKVKWSGRNVNYRIDMGDTGGLVGSTDLVD